MSLDRPIARDLAASLLRVDEDIATASRRLSDSGLPAMILIDGGGKPLREVRAAHLARMRIAGFSASTPLSALPPAPSPVATPEDEADAQAAMRARGLSVLALLDAKGRIREVVPRERERILMSPPHMSGEEEAFLADAFDSNWIAPLGPHVDGFEAELARTVGAPEGGVAALCSGSAALHLALRLAGVEAGDEVVASSLTFIASVAPVLYQGARPIFVDSEPDSWNMSPVALERALEDARRRGVRPRAAIITDIYGQGADFDALGEICARHQVTMIEDAAEALGASYRDRRCGALAPFAALSFNGNKIITTSGGGALVTRDPDMAARARFLSTQAREPAAHYQHETFGYNYRMSNLLAAVGRAQLRRLPDRVAGRRRVFETYRAALDGVPGLDWMPEASFGVCNRWLSVATVDPEATGGVDAAGVIESLNAAGCEARPVWKPMHRQPVFAGAPYSPHSDARSVSDHCFARGLCLPSGADMTEAEIGRVADALRGALERK